MRLVIYYTVLLIKNSHFSNVIRSVEQLIELPEFSNRAISSTREPNQAECSKNARVFARLFQTRANAATAWWSSVELQMTIAVEGWNQGLTRFLCLMSIYLNRYIYYWNNSNRRCEKTGHYEKQAVCQWHSVNMKLGSYLSPEPESITNKSIKFAGIHSNFGNVRAIPSSVQFAYGSAIYCKTKNNLLT